MPRYDFTCDKCGETFERSCGDGWDRVLAIHPDCGGLAHKQPHYHTLKFTVPSSFHTDIRDVVGNPDDVKDALRKGEIVPAPGNRWA